MTRDTVGESQFCSTSQDKYRVKTVPSSIYYISEFITPTEEELLLSKINTPNARWTELSHRRLQSHPSALTAKNVLLASPLPTWLESPIVTKLNSLEKSLQTPSIFGQSPHMKPNHVLINEYDPGQGIMPHEDGSAYWPVVATVSLGSALVLNIYKKDRDGRRVESPTYRILQEPRSLLITTRDMYNDYMHGIEEVDVDENLGSETVANWSLLGDSGNFVDGQHVRQKRISLTYRDVLKVSNLGTKLNLLKR